MRILNLLPGDERNRPQTGGSSRWETRLPSWCSIPLRIRKRAVAPYPGRMMKWWKSHCLHLLELFGQEEILHPPLLVTGHDVMALGYSAGPRVGEILTFIRQKQVEGEIKTREEAMAFLRDNFRINPEV